MSRRRKREGERERERNGEGGGGKREKHCYKREGLESLSCDSLKLRHLFN